MFNHAYILPANYSRGKGESGYTSHDDISWHIYERKIIYHDPFIKYTVQKAFIIYNVN